MAKPNATLAPTDAQPAGLFGTLVLQEPQSGEADGQWKLAAPFFYEARRCFEHCDRRICLLAQGSRGPTHAQPDHELCRLVIPVETRTDLASIPRPAEWLFRRYGAYTDAAVIHDELCDPKYPGDQRFYADWLFRNLMTRDLRVFPPRAWIMWAAVSIATFKDRRLLVFLALVLTQLVIWAAGVVLVWQLSWWGVALIVGLCPVWFWGATRIGRRPGWKRAVFALPLIITPMTPVILLMAVVALALLFIGAVEAVAAYAFGGRKDRIGAVAKRRAPSASSAPGPSTRARPSRDTSPAPAGQPLGPTEPEGRWRVNP